MADVLLDKYDIYYDLAGSKLGFMLAKDKKGPKIWRRDDERGLPESFASGDISYANLSPDIQKVISHRYMHGGLGALEFEVEDDFDYQILRYLRSQNVDLRCKGKAYPSPKIVTLTMPTHTVSDYNQAINYYDADSEWADEANAIDGNDATRATEAAIGTESWSKWLEIYVPSISCSKMRFKWDGIDLWINKIDVDLYYDGAWNHLYEGADGDGAEVEKSIGATKTVTAARARLYNGSDASAKNGYLYVLEFYAESATVLGKPTKFEVWNGEKYFAKGNALLKLNGDGSEYDIIEAFKNDITSLATFSDDNLYLARGTGDIYWYMEGDLLHNCETVWTELVDTDVTASVDESDKKVGAGSLKLVVADGCAAGDILATEAITSIDISGHKQVILLIKSTVALDANDLQLLLDEHVLCGSPSETINIPAVTANTWTAVLLTLSAAAGDLDAIISIGIKMAVDKGEFTVRLDNIRALKYTESALGAPNKFDKFRKVGTELWGMILPNTIHMSTNPLVAWGAAITVGEAGYNINDLQEYDDDLYCMKEEGVFYEDAGSIYNPFPELRSIAHADSGKNSTVFRDGLYFRMGNQQEWEIKGGVLTEITPELSAPGISQYAYPFVARAHDESWLYTTIKRGATDLAILAGRWEYVSGLTRWIWHEIRSIDLTDVATAFVCSVEGRPYLYLGSTLETENVYKVYLPITNDATADGDYRFHTAGAGVTLGSLWTPRYMSLLFALTKRWQEVFMRSLNLSATNYINAYYSTDDGTTFPTLLLKFITSPEQTGAFTNIDATMMNLRFDFVGDSETVPPVMKYHNLKAQTKMASVTRFYHTVKCADGLRLNKNHVAGANYTAAVIRAFVDGLRDNVCTLGDPWGTEHTVRVRVTREEEVFDEGDQKIETRFSIEAVKI